MKETNIKDLSFNVFNDIGVKWCLISARKKDGSVNTMTASWGGLGVLWSKNVATIYIRPQRYTKEFIDEADTFTISFLDEKYRKQLQICGTKSGRDIDKLKECNLHLIDNQEVIFEESDLTYVCKKLYVDEIKEEKFLDKDIVSKHYPTKDFHTIYIGEILKIVEK